MDSSRSPSGWASSEVSAPQLAPAESPKRGLPSLVTGVAYSSFDEYLLLINEHTDKTKGDNQLRPLGSTKFSNNHRS